MYPSSKESCFSPGISSCDLGLHPTLGYQATRFDRSPIPGQVLDHLLLGRAMFACIQEFRPFGNTSLNVASAVMDNTRTCIKNHTPTPIPALVIYGSVQRLIIVKSKKNMLICAIFPMLYLECCRLVIALISNCPQFNLGNYSALFHYYSIV